MNEKKTFASGKAIVLQLSEFRVSARLRKVVAKEIRTIDFKEVMKLAGGLSPEELLAKGDLPIDTLKDLACQLLASDEVEEALWECMKVCQYNGERITPETFEPEDARADYLPAAWEVMVLNLAPFFKGLNLRSLIGGGSTAKSSQSSE